MEGLITNAKSFLGTEEGKNVEQQIKDKTGFDVNQYLGDSSNNANGDPQTQDQSPQPPSIDAAGNQGQAGQFGEEGQYGAVRGKGFGGGLTSSGQQGQGQQGQQGQGGKSAYEGFDNLDSTASGGYGKNAAGDSFSRQNQIGAGEENAPQVGFDDDEAGHGYKTGTSTPGYRQEGDVDGEAAENRIRNQNLNVYGQQADDRGSTGNDYNEAN